MKFSDRLAALGFASYDAYLASAHWQSFKAAYRQSGRPMRCAVCQAKRIQLHHHTYKRLGAERQTDVTPLCREHHEAVHVWLKANDAFVDQTAKAVAALRPLIVAQPVRKKKKKRTPEQRAARIERRRLNRELKQEKLAAKKAESAARRKERDQKIAAYVAEQADNPMAFAVANALRGGAMRPFGHPLEHRKKKQKRPLPAKTVKVKGPAQTPPTPKPAVKPLRILRPRRQTET